jgi:predicted anti-sigma-YlaC factor YlaD
MTCFFRRLFNRGEADCAETRELASDYLEDDLAPRRQAAVQSHLDKCGPCRAFVEALSTTIGLLGRLPRVSVPASFRQTVMNRTKTNDPGESG